MKDENIAYSITAGTHIEPAGEEIEKPDILTFRLDGPDLYLHFENMSILIDFFSRFIHCVEDIFYMYLADSRASLEDLGNCVRDFD